jgi:hypothetical protein
MVEFTCGRCLEAAASSAVPNANGGTDHWCDSCLEKFIADEMLDMVNRGELRVSGSAFETTPLFDARRKYEKGED